ncbi:MAG: acylneuraminate cytidylyltransferase family protein, partial [Candidatus Peregrinibacteria bacterium]|nr:acylneuraminate cytidylyltransferase family protein [Candidatus Peregrinibacteria bacterium]
MDWTFLPGKTYAIIGARSGSKNVPQKNIYNIHGFPLLAYSIAAGILTPEIERVLVSTNSKQFKAVAEQFGGEVPFLRPDELATDTSTDRDFIVHTLETLQKQEGGIPEYLVFLRPTSPLRDPKKISEALAYFKEMPEATGLRSAHVTNIIPQKL